MSAICIEQSIEDSLSSMVASPLDKEGLQGGNAGTTPLALRDRCRFAPPLQRRGFSEGTPRLLRQGVRMNVDPLLISPLFASQGGESRLPSWTR